MILTPLQLRDPLRGLFRKALGRGIDAFETEFAINSSSSALYNVACAMALSGDGKQALDMLERAILAGSGDYGSILRDADLRSLRREPRFRDLLDLAKDLEPTGVLGAMGSRWGWQGGDSPVRARRT